MRFKYSFFLLLVTFVCCVQFIKAQTPQLSESSKVSLLTNTPWDGAVYALFGHTSIRINDPANNIDIVFNYGLFDYDSPNFMYRFARGETDYSVGYTQMDRYMFEYQMKGIGITEQVLDLEQNEKQKIFESLLSNCEPENRIYRYNYFYDNCTTRARDMIENNIDGKIVYPEPVPTKMYISYRSLVHQCVDSEPWVRFGIDLVIGADADKPIDMRQAEFLPSYLKKDFEKASINSSLGTTRKLVLSEHQMLEQTSQSSNLKPTDTPLIVGIIVLIISILMSYLSYRNKLRGVTKFFDFLLFFIAGLAGCVIFFLMYFSTHPCTNPNWNLVWLNPIQLIFAFLLLIKFFSKGVYYYHFINFVLLIAFLLAWFLIPQSLEVAFIPYILAIAIRSGVNVLRYKKQHNSIVSQ